MNQLIILTALLLMGCSRTTDPPSSREDIRSSDTVGIPSTVATSQSELPGEVDGQTPPTLTVSLRSIAIEDVSSGVPCVTGRCELVLRIENESDVRVRALMGTLGITDAFDRKLVVFELEYSRPIASRDSVDVLASWRADPRERDLEILERMLRQWAEDAPRIRSSAVENLELHWIPRVILFGDSDRYEDSQAYTDALSEFAEAGGESPFRFLQLVGVPTFRLDPR